jgi:hypothetical protein
MNILFFIQYDPFTKNQWDGETIRNGGAAVSGTHQTVVLVAEYLAKHTPYNIYIVNHCNNKTYNGVTYVDLVHNLPETIDTLVVPNSFTYVPLSNISALKHLIVWNHCPGYNQFVHNILHSLTQTNNTRLSFVHLSDWSMKNVMGIFRSMLPLYKNVKIPNALMVDCIPADIDFGESRPNNAIFFACWERGRMVAERCWQKAKQRSHNFGEFIKLDYAGTGGGQKGDKTFVFNTYTKARYFIYPLVNSQNGLIHRDTFACVVAEAIACGVEVLTYPVAALKENYEGLVTWIPFPQSVNADDVDLASPQYPPCIPAFAQDTQDEVIIKLLLEMDATYEQRTTLRREHAQKVIQMFSPESVFSPWISLLD